MGDRVLGAGDSAPKSVTLSVLAEHMSQGLLAWFASTSLRARLP